jgi:hypothetical protein
LTPYRRLFASCGSLWFERLCWSFACRWLQWLLEKRCLVAEKFRKDWLVK